MAFPARLGLLLAVLAISAACGGDPASLEERARAALSQTQGRIRLDGLAKPVEVLRDTWGVPHIYAQTVEDLFFAQGFVAAQDRLFQMDVWRRAGAGELAEILGPDYLERDRFARLMRYRGDPEAEWTSYAPDARAILAAFARGVNAFIGQAGGRLPVEFELLAARPGAWKPEDCLLRIAGLLMTRNAATEVDRARLLQRLGPQRVAELMPTDPPARLSRPTGLLEGIDSTVLQSYQGAIAPVRFDTESGSNNWVVDGTLSATGKPLLANDPHRPVVVPSLRYLTHLVGPGWNVIGAGEPALPGVAVGHNERVAFGFTIVGIDQQDIYVERTDPANPNRYRYRGDWREMRLERDKIRVKGRPEPAEVELKFTVHGPVIHEDAARHRAFVLRWAGHEPGGAGYLACLSLNRAKNWKDFLAAMERWKIPSENLIYADVDGNIGWMAAGLAPVRRGWTGLTPVAGEDGAYEWQGYLPASELPQAFNPPGHYIATANHNILPPRYRHQLGYEWNPAFRFRRVDEVLRAGKKFTVEDFQKLQHDETSLVARELLAMLKAAPDDGSEARRLLASWDAVLSKDSAPAALYQLWRRRLLSQFLSSLAPADVLPILSRRMNDRHVLDLLARQPPGARNALLRRSLEEAWTEARRALGDEVAQWRWGALHQIRFHHALALDEERRRLFDLGPTVRGGDSNTVNNTGGGGFRQTSGASYRQILDVADWDRSVATSVPGQSGQPASPHYADLLPLWAEGKYFPLPYSRSAVEKHTTEKLILEPKR